MKAGLILALLLLVLVGGTFGYYLYYFYGIQSSSSTTSPSTSCPHGQTSISGACVNNCTNDATNPPSCTSPLQCTDPYGINSHFSHPSRLTLVNSCNPD